MRLIEAKLGELSWIGRRAIRAQVLGEFSSVGNKIHADHPTPCRFQNLYGELAKKAKTDYSGDLTQLCLGCADAVHGNCADRAESCFFE